MLRKDKLISSDNNSSEPLSGSDVVAILTPPVDEWDIIALDAWANTATDDDSMSITINDNESAE